MTPERWQQVKLLFNRAMDCEPAARAAFLTEHVGEDLELLREIESLLASADEPGGTLQTPAARLTGDVPDESNAAMVGRHVGPYRLVREVGWGGMGTVYEAVRADEEFRKRVAIKVVRREMATPLVVRRFRHERQILAELNHPNIASLLDGGVTEDGRPYFAMEYIEGQPIDVYCKARGLSVRDRIALFLEVCDAVQSAHRSLVVHRDLKPSNILVTATGQPKLLDFGIAKLLDDSTAGGAPLTHAGDLLFTPDYACPEQVRGGGPITTASDVYSLGIILYELLAGRRPYRTEGRPLHDIVRTITEDEPAPPGTVVRTRLSGELDSIVMKAIRKEPEQRYLSVEQLAEDLRRHLDGRPVLAQSGTALYRMRKFVRRHTAVVATVGLVIVTLVGGIVATLIQAQRAETERARAEARFNDVRGLANSVLFEIHDAIADLPGATATRALLMSRGVEYLDRLSRQSRDDPTLEREIADAYLRLGRVQGLPTAANLGDLGAARKSYLRALAIGERLLEANPADRAARRTVASAHEKLSDVEGHAGDLPAAVTHARAALRNWEELSEGKTSSIAAMLPVAISYTKLGDVLGGPSFLNIDDDAGAMAAYERSLAILAALPAASGRDRTVRRYIGLVHERIGEMHLELGREAEAIDSFQKSFAIRQALSHEAPADRVMLRDVGVSHEKICSVHVLRGDARAGTPHCRESLEIFRRLFESDRDDTFARTTLAIGHDWMHRALAAEGKLEAALPEMERSASLFRELLAEQGESAAIRRHYARSLLKLSSLHARLPGADHRRRAEIALEQGRAALEGLRKDGSVDSEDEEQLREAVAQLGTAGADPRSIR